jgi:membrane fusion protein, copper/silver efflux system
LLGLSEAQILELTKSKKERYTVAVYSPYSGYIVEETFINNLATESVSAPPENGMGGMAENDPSAASPVSSSNPTALKIREGQYLNAGQSVFKVVDTERLWAEFDLKQRDIGYIRQNDQVFVELTPNGQKIKATVSQVRPFLNSGESFAKVRVDLNNSDSRIKVGTLVAGNFKKNIENASWIPTSALVDLGNESVVFVKTKDVFQSRKIITGVQTGDFTEVIKGIEPGDEIAENGQFMVDSESFIRSEN